MKRLRNFGLALLVAPTIAGCAEKCTEKATEREFQDLWGRALANAGVTSEITPYQRGTYLRGIGTNCSNWVEGITTLELAKDSTHVIIKVYDFKNNQFETYVTDICKMREYVNK